MAGLTKLQAVNELLAAGNLYPVSALDPGGTSDAASAEDQLDRTSAQVQSQGWHCNTEREVTLEVPTVTVTVGSVVGTFIAGETVTQATSGATGQYHQTDGTTMYLSDITGTWDGSHAITGGTSGATADVSATATVTSAEIVVADDVLSVDTAGESFSMDVAVIDGKLYNRDDDTTTFTGDLVVDLVRYHGFADLPPWLRRLVTAEAVRTWQRRTIGDATADAAIREELAEARLEAARKDTETADYNILNTRTAQRVRGRTGAYHPAR